MKKVVGILAVAVAAFMIMSSFVGKGTGIEFAKINFDENDTPLNMVGVVRDITQQKETQINLQHSEHIFRSTLENLDMIAVQLDVNGNIRFANRQNHEGTCAGAKSSAGSK